MTAAMESIESVDKSKGNVLLVVDDLTSLDNEGNLLQESGTREAELQTDRTKSLAQQIDSAVNDSRRGLFILEYVSQVLIDSDDGKDNSLCMGQLVKDYVVNVLDRLERVELLVSDLGRIND